MADRDDDRLDVDRELARLAGATADLKADDRFVEAMLSAAAGAAEAEEDPLARVARATATATATAEEEDSLARLARATAGLEPDAAFTDAVLQAVKAAPLAARSAVTEGIVRSGRAAIVMAALAAAASVLFFFRTQSQLDEAIVSSVDTVEVGE